MGHIKTLNDLQLLLSTEVPMSPELVDRTPYTLNADADAGYMMDAGMPYYSGVAAAACHYSWQLTDVDLDSRQDCLAKFVSNKWFGALVFSGIVADKLLTQAPIVTELC